MISELFKRNNNTLLSFYGSIVFILVFLFSSCNNNRGNAQQKTTSVSDSFSPQKYEESIVYEQVQVAETSKEETKITEKENIVENPPVVMQTTTISKYYEEGYEAGYDDGEDDAVMNNGWGGQYDDSCIYKGKKRKEYQLGYEEGYEAGYYDNCEGDE